MQTSHMTNEHVPTCQPISELNSLQDTFHITKERETQQNQEIQPKNSQVRRIFKKKGRPKRIDKKVKQFKDIKIQQPQPSTHDENSKKNIDESVGAPPTRTRHRPLRKAGRNPIDYFSNDIDKDYLGRPTRENIETIQRIREKQGITVRELLKESGRKLRKKEQNVMKYLRFLKEVKRNQKEIVVMLKKLNKYHLLYYEFAQQASSNNKQASKCVQQPSTDMLVLSGDMQVQLNEYNLLSARMDFMGRLEKIMKVYNSAKDTPKQISEIDKQIIFLNDSNRLHQSQYANLIDGIEHKLKVAMETQIQPDPEPVLDKYKETLIFKGLSKGLKDFEFDIMNYYKKNASKQHNKIMVPLENTKQLMEYIKKKKIKKNKKAKHPLATACLGCFSNYTEQTNPMRNCYECGARFHKNCQLVSNQNCSFCEWRKTKRTNNKECVFCTKSGLLLKNIATDLSAHVFCLIAYNIYMIKGGVAVLKQNFHKIVFYNQNKQKCFVCDSSQGVLQVCKCNGCCLKCEYDCKNYVHATCAYFSGYHLQCEIRGQLKYHCCRYSQAELIKNTFKRKYSLNYQRFGYRYYSQEEYIAELNGHPIVRIQKNQMQDQFLDSDGQ